MDISKADLGLFVALDALLEEEAVTPAARRLGVSQPAMSAQLARLRRRFGDPLLVQSGRKLVPTDRARRLKAPLRRLLSDLDALVREETTFAPSETKATFRVIATDYVHSTCGALLSSAFSAEAPNARLALLPFDPPAVWTMLEEGEADVALATNLNLPDALSRKLFSEDFVVARRKGHPRAETPLSLEGFCAERHILVSPEGGGFRGAADAILAKQGATRSVACSAPSFLLAPQMVAATDMLCLLPRRMAASFPDEIEALETPFPTPSFDVAMLWHPRRRGDPAHQWLRERIIAALPANADRH